MVVDLRVDGEGIGVLPLGLVPTREHKIGGGVDHFHDVANVGIGLDVAVGVGDLVRAVLFVEVGDLSLD